MQYPIQPIRDGFAQGAGALGGDMRLRGSRFRCGNAW